MIDAFDLHKAVMPCITGIVKRVYCGALHALSHFGPLPCTLLCCGMPAVSDSPERRLKGREMELAVIQMSRRYRWLPTNSRLSDAAQLASAYADIPVIRTAI